MDPTEIISSISSQSTIAAAKWYIKEGFFPVPIPAGKKGPLKKNWPDFRCEEADASSHFGHRSNIGIILTAGLVCVDLDHPMAAALAHKYLPPTGCIIGRPGNPASHWIYRTAPGQAEVINRQLRYVLDGKWHTVLDVLSEGKQVVVGPSMHPSGDRYDPLQGDIPFISALELVSATEALFGAVVATLEGAGLAVGKIEQSPMLHEPKSRPSGGGGRSGDDFNDRGDIREVLIRNGWVMIRPGDNEHWRRPGKEAGGASATLLHGKKFYNFSSNSPSLEAGRLYDAFGLLVALEYGGNFAAASFSLRLEGWGEGAGFSSLDEAPDYSWVGKQEGSLAEEIQEVIQEEALLFPSECLRPPGLISEIIDFNLTTASHPQPVLALAGALALMSTITGNRVRSFPNHTTFTNLYILSLAPTGAGKEHARNINQDLLVAAGGIPFIGCESISSAAGIITALDKQPVQLMQLDEIADMLTTMRNATKSPHLYQIGPVLKTVKTSAGRVVKGPALKHEEDLKELRYPHLVIYGTSIPDGFWESISSTQVFDGLLSRFLIFEGSYVRVKAAKDNPPPVGLVEAMTSWISLNQGSGAFAQIVRKSNREIPPMTLVAHTPEALARAIGHMDQINERQIEEAKTDPSRAAIWSRTAENTNQISLLFACSRWDIKAGGEPKISIDDVNLAIKLSNWMTRKMLVRVVSHVSESDHERMIKRILRQVPKGGITQRNLQRACQWIRSREFHELMASLVDMELIEIISLKTGKKGKPSKIVKKALADPK